MVDTCGTPHSDVVERYRLIDYGDANPAMERNEKENIRFRTENAALEVDPNYRRKHLQLEFTVEDETVFTVPWSATITYRRPLGAREEHVCAENRFGLYTTGREANCEQAGFLSGNRRTRRVKTNLVAGSGSRGAYGRQASQKLTQYGSCTS
jgi:hypothetical protein